MSAPRHPTHPVSAAQAPPDRATAPVSAVVIGANGTLSTITRHTEQAPDGTSLVVVVVAGDVDHDSTPTLRATLREALARSTQVCCDVSAVTFFGAAGAATVLDAQQRAQARGAAFTIRGARGLTREVLAFVGLGTVLRPGV